MGQDISILSRLFSDYRAEWFDADYDTRFVTPPYYQRLKSLKPLFLIGGRGTGKTVSLKSLRYDNTGLYNSQRFPIDNINIGTYIRFNKNRVTVFDKDEDTENLKWDKLFAHYFNLLCADELCKLMLFEVNNNRVESLTDQQFNKISNALILDCVAGESDQNNLNRVIQNVDESVILLQNYINNPYNMERPNLSISEYPIKLICDIFRNNDNTGDRHIYICLDEYENLYPYQQKIINTYVKHAESPMSYKIGVRKNGLKTKEIVGGGDLLTKPEDYDEVDLDESDDNLSEFLVEVVSYRLKRARYEGLEVPTRPEEFLASLTWEEEATLLGARRYATKVRKRVIEEAADDVRRWIDDLSTAELYFIKYWAMSKSSDVVSEAIDWYKNPDQWRHRLNNYKNASLFWISKGQKGKRIKKYYSGMNTYLKLSSGNVRYLLELIDECIGVLQNDDTSFEDRITISPLIQTKAAKKVGKRRLNQLQGLSTEGERLKRLVLVIGRVFFEYARSPLGRAPEKTTFVLTGNTRDKKRIKDLLDEGVAHLAFQSFPKTKMTSEYEIRDDEYRLHPIYSPFFEFSHRKKRRVHFDASTLLTSLEGSPTLAIKQMLDEGLRATEEEKLPDQLRLFSDFYSS